MNNVLLLRAPAEGVPDRYERAFEARGYSPISVPVLETVIVNVEDLMQRIVAGPKEQDLSGVIITSKRAVEAWSKAVEHLTCRSNGSSASSVDWRDVPFYVVGEATASATAEMARKFDGGFTSNDIRGGAESGTAERLASFILRDALPSSEKPTKLLYLTGDKNRDTLRQALTAGNVSLDALQVYGTQGLSSFESDLKSALGNAPGGDRRQYEWAGPAQCWGWAVFFSPSVADFVTPVLRGVFHLHGREDSSQESEKPFIRVAVIGPTTASFLQETLGLLVDVVPAKPTPDDLVIAIIAFDSA
ncbi:tetrapyrrole biosynthesis, uroporphyrinogen III synthase [Phlebopus sp. FC_14]|nr:tetrapyrrole biosynthesis, uroporphyrinogen III synthase [Phlebopus sp. FC_14]